MDGDNSEHQWNVREPLNHDISNTSLHNLEPDLLVSKTSNKTPQKARGNFTLSSNRLQNEIPLQYEQDDMTVYKSTPVVKNDLSSYPSCGRGSRKNKSEGSNYIPHQGIGDRSLDDLHIHNRNNNDTMPRPTRLHELTKVVSGAEIDEKLIDQNATLLKDLEETKKSVLRHKVASAFTFEAFRSQLKTLKDLKEAKQRKDEEAAARMILHNLLLNSWRNSKCELDNLLEDNAQLHKTMENLALQLRVVRHLHGVDKEKVVEKVQEVERMKVEIATLTDDNKRSHSSIEKMESQLNMVQANIQNLQELNRKYQIDTEEMENQIKTLEESLEKEMSRNGCYQNDNETLNKEKERLEAELNDITKQNNHWQEQSRSFESESWGLKMDIETKTAEIKDIKSVCENLKTDKDNLIRMKTALKDQLNETSDKLEQANVDNGELNENLNITKLKMKDQIDRIVKLESSLNKAKKEYTEIEKELMLYKLKNVKRRRDWANALYFMVNPIDALRRSLSNSSEGTKSNLPDIYNPRTSI